MLAKFENGSPCTIRAIIDLSNNIKFICMTDNGFITIDKLERKSNGRIKKIYLTRFVPMYTTVLDYYVSRVSEFEGNERQANDWLNDIFKSGVSIDEEALKGVCEVSLKGATLLWTADDLQKHKSLIDIAREDRIRNAPGNKHLDENGIQELTELLNQTGKDIIDHIITGGPKKSSSQILYLDTEGSLSGFIGQVKKDIASLSHFPDKFLLREMVLSKEKINYASSSCEAMYMED